MRWLVIAVFGAFFGLFLTCGSAWAVNPDEVLADANLEARARALSAQFRCMVCQNQSIDDSNAELARDLRVLVRERLVNGDSDEAVVTYVVSRYGEFVLLKPRFEGKTLILWGAPILLLAGSAVAMAVYAVRRRVRHEPEPLSEKEQDRLEQILRES